MLRAAVSGFIIFLLGASLVFPLSASAHNIDVEKAREVARTYARQVRDESGGKYAHYSTSCVSAFPNHNHIARCIIDYQNEADTKKGVYTCRELIEIKVPVHGYYKGISFELYGWHVSSECGNRRLNNTRM